MKFIRALIISKISKNIMKQNIKRKAFSLVELSVVILISSILIVGALAFSTAGVNNAKVKNTRDKINALYSSLGNYLLTNKKLPCPASLKVIKSSSPNTYGAVVGADGTCTGAGIYNNAGGTNPRLVYGMVPVKALGLSNDMAEDGFGNKIVYMVDARFTVSDLASPPGFGLQTAVNNITVEDNVNGTLGVSTTTAIFALISYGANQYGAFGANSTIENSISADADEQNNINDNANSLDVAVNFNNIIVSSSLGSDIFDDIVLFKTRNQIAIDFNALSLIPCPAVASGANLYVVNGTNITWPQSYYNQIAISTVACPTGYIGGSTYPTKRCEAFGNWGAVINPCIPK
jgi:prepilin-type N-terminal cleavage/methylation domain-containing protein